ncbi:MAG TPA: glycerol-3-phosphate 1-O-acyltransferase PlsY [Allosphingosinicella sp.]
MSLELLAAPLLSLLVGYLLGSIPFGVLLTRMAGAGDLRSVGSGNIGATNVLRTGRKGLAALTLVLDGAKGAAAVIIVRAVWPGSEGLAAVGALLGHLYPVWIGFKGGKGVATFFGIMAALHWESSIGYAVVWLGVLALTRYSSVAGMSAALLAPVAAAVLGRFDLSLLYLGFGLLIFWKHRANLERLFAGTEPRVGSSKESD